MYKILIAFVFIGFIGCVSAPILSVEAGTHTAMINRMGIDPKGNFLITPSDDRTLRMWNMRNGELMKVFRVPIGYYPHEGDDTVRSGHAGWTVSCFGL